MAKTCASAFEPFGDQAPLVEPYWYQGYPTAYYNDSHVEFRAKCRNFCDKEISPYLDGWIASGDHYPKELHVKALAAGLPTAGLAADVQSLYPQAMVPKGGFDPFHELIYLDEMARAGGGSVMGQAGINSMALPPILFAGSKHVQSLVVDGVISGHKNICLAISEPSAGSDVANIRLTARREGDFYVVSGQKKWITGGNMADYFTLACRTGGAGGGGLSLLLVDRNTAGIDIRKMPTQFDTCQGTTFITFDEVKVPAENIIGKEGAGFKYLLLNFNHERFVISCSTCRYARLCYAESLHYAVRRKTFGKPLADHQMIRWKLSEMARQVQALHDMNERIAFQYKSGVPDATLGGHCAMLKVMASKTFEFCAREASQIFGGSSIVKEGNGKMVERLYREVRAQAIPGGSEEILLDLVARQAIAGAAKSAANAKL
jgi:alkylation response protein AidB-like acyl-CoA dehydrogenase